MTQGPTARLASMRPVLVAALLLAGMACSPRPAQVAAVEPVHTPEPVRIPGAGEVAVIGDRPILLTELRARAKPFLIEIAKKMPPGAQRAAAESWMYKELLARMIDEELERQAAEKAKITVTTAEVDRGVRELAAQAGDRTVADLLRRVQLAGLTEQEYRDEVRRQILEAKLVRSRVYPEAPIPEEDVKAMYERTLREERRQLEYHPRWIVLRAPTGASPGAQSELQRLAREIAARVKAGEDFGDLARRYSDDGATRQLGGDLEIRAPLGAPQVKAGRREALAAELDAAVQALEPGQITEPIPVAEAVVIVQLVERQPSRFTTFEAAKQEMGVRVRAEKLENARRTWLDELKSHTHVEVRL
jgi:peptidyl-prolyl cis-trans isomerase SurA